MTEPNAVFYLLKEYGVDFDEQLFRDTYLRGEERIWWDIKEVRESTHVSGTFLEDRLPGSTN